MTNPPTRQNGKIRGLQSFRGKTRPDQTHRRSGPDPVRQDNRRLLPHSPREGCRALETWRLVDHEYRDNPYMNLAVEEAIPRMVGEGKAPSTVRFWHNSNTIVIGCFQSAKLEVNMQACKETGPEIVRRFTGGGAVDHDSGNLNYAISLRKGHRLVPDQNLQSVFGKL